MKKEKPDMRTLGLQLTVNQIKRLKAYCWEEDRSLAWFVRLALDEWLDKKDGEKKAKETKS